MSLFEIREENTLKSYILSDTSTASNFLNMSAADL